MGIKAAYKLNDVDSIDATLSISMKVGLWKELVDQINNVFPNGVPYPLIAVKNNANAVIIKALEEYQEVEGDDSLKSF